MSGDGVSNETGGATEARAQRGSGGSLEAQRGLGPSVTGANDGAARELAKWDARESALGTVDLGVFGRHGVGDRVFTLAGWAKLISVDGSMVVFERSGRTFAQPTRSFVADAVTAAPLAGVGRSAASIAAVGAALASVEPVHLGKGAYAHLVISLWYRASSGHPLSVYLDSSVIKLVMGTSAPTPPRWLWWKRPDIVDFDPGRWCIYEIKSRTPAEVEVGRLQVHRYCTLLGMTPGTEVFAAVGSVPTPWGEVLAWRVEEGSSGIITYQFFDPPQVKVRQPDARQVRDAMKTLVLLVALVVAGVLAVEVLLAILSTGALTAETAALVAALGRMVAAR